MDETIKIIDNAKVMTKEEVKDLKKITHKELRKSVINSNKKLNQINVLREYFKKQTEEKTVEEIQKSFPKMKDLYVRLSQEKRIGNLVKTEKGYKLAQKESISDAL